MVDDMLLVAAFVDIGALQGLRLRIIEAKWLCNGHPLLTLGLVQLLLELVLEALELGTGLRLIDQRFECEFLLMLANFRILLLVLHGLLHAPWHLCQRIAFLGGQVDALESLLLLKFHLF